jgi:hypothetical protein
VRRNPTPSEGAPQVWDSDLPEPPVQRLVEGVSGAPSGFSRPRSHPMLTLLTVVLLVALVESMDHRTGLLRRLF